MNAEAMLIAKMILGIAMCIPLQLAACDLPSIMQAWQPFINIALFSMILCIEAYVLWKQSQRLAILKMRHIQAEKADLGHTKIYMKILIAALVSLFSISLSVDLEMRTHAVLSSFLIWSTAICAGIEKATKSPKS